MPAQIARSVITSNHKYVCLSCRLQDSSLAGARTRRYQHTGPPDHHGGDTNRESIPKDAGNHEEATSASQIGNIIRNFLFKSDAKGIRSKGDSRTESLVKEMQLPHLPDCIPSITPQPRNSAHVLQQKLQQKFAVQRRKDMLAMQANQASKASEEKTEVPKACSVPESTKQSPKKSHRAKRAERKRKLKKAALGKKATTRSKRTQAKPVEVALNQVTEVTTSTEPQRAEEPSVNSEASARKSPETLRAEGNDNDSEGNVRDEQTATAQKLVDIMEILESSKKQNKPRKPAKVAGKAKPSSTDTKRKAAAVATLDELQKSGERPDVDSRKPAAMISHNSIQLLAHLKANPKKTSESLNQILHNSLSGDDSLVRKVTSDSPMAPSTETALKKRDLIPSFRKLPSVFKDKSIPTNDSNVSGRKSVAPSFMSLQAALGKKFGKVKGVDLDSLPNLPSENVKKAKASPKLPIEKATASDLELLPVEVDQPPVPSLAYGLERVLFNPGVYQLQDPRSRVYNFDPYLQKIMPVAEFDFNALKEYITSSRDQSLLKIAKKHGKRYMGSTSSMTEVLAHFHFLLSQWRPINPSMLSKAFPVHLKSFTELQRTPSAIILRWKDGSYAIDADKQFANASVLTMLGKSMEKMLTLRTVDFERYRKSDPGQVTEDEQSAPESYHYSALGGFLMRSQLDAHDSRLPGTGMFDLKTRSVVSIRMDVANYEHGVGYEIKSRQGEWESYEREYHDMIRAAFLKYSLQVRMGRMDGIFVAFHNIERIFGFQYISLPEMDSTLHGQWDTSIGDQEFRLSLGLMNRVLDRATKKYPETSLRIHFETRDVQTPFMYIFAEPVTEEQVEEIQSQNSVKIQEFERKVLGLTRGNGSDTDDTQDDDSKWENIQADVQEAMDKDELSIDQSGQDQEGTDEDAEGTDTSPERPKVFEQGPLYASKSPAGANDDVNVASAGGGEEDDGDIKDNDEVDGEEEREEEEEEDEDEDAEGNRQVEDSRVQEGLVEILEDKADIKANDAIEAERAVGGDGAEENAMMPNESNPVEVQNDADWLTEGNNEDDTAGATSGQGSTDEVRESANGKDDISSSPEAKTPSILDGEGQQESQTQADRHFLDSIDQEVTQADIAAKPSPSEDILAMTLTLRNKVNGGYVLRPENMTAADEWSIEYSLTEVTEQSRARALYKACQSRRSKKMESSLVPQDMEFISVYIEKLRKMSAKGRAWRKEQDKTDRKRPVQVL